MANVPSSGGPLTVLCSIERKGCGSTPAWHRAFLPLEETPISPWKAFLWKISVPRLAEIRLGMRAIEHKSKSVIASVS